MPYSPSKRAWPQTWASMGASIHATFTDQILYSPQRGACIIGGTKQSQRNLGRHPSRAARPLAQQSAICQAFSLQARWAASESHQELALSRQGSTRRNSRRGRLLVSNAGGGASGLAKKGPRKKRRGGAGEVRTTIHGVMS